MNEKNNIHSYYKEDIKCIIILRKKCLLVYFSITFILLGLVTCVFLIGDLSLLKYGWLFLVGTLAPTIAAITVSYAAINIFISFFI